jgi:hypothetical protein
MRLGSLAWGVVVAAAGGCLSLGGRPAPDRIDPSTSYAPPAASDKVVFRTALVDRPAGDPYLTRGLWADALKPLPAEAAALLAENGLRVGVFVGRPPTELARLLADDSAVRPQDGTAAVGDPKPVPVNGPVPAAKFGLAVEVGGSPHPFDLSAVECAVALSGRPADDAGLRVGFEPRVQYGERQNWIRPTGDGTGLTWRDAKAEERFGKLGWELTVGPNDYVVVGPTESPGGTLGGVFFLPQADGRPRMRVLVVRGWRLAADPPAGKRPASIAAQAGQTVGRR